jgi:hypothetical protein
MSAIQDLENNIDRLNEVILSLNEDVKPFDLSQHILTKRQIAKKIFASVSQYQPPDEKSIHILVYGKYMVGMDGKVVDNEIKYPECVDKDKALSINHPIMKDTVKNMVRDIKNSFRVLNIKSTELKDAFKLAVKQIAIAAPATVSAATTLPIGSGVAPALAGIQNIVASIKTLQSRVLEILPVLGPLINLPLIIMEESLNLILSMVNTVLIVLIEVLGLIADLRNLIKPVLLLVK